MQCPNRPGSRKALKHFGSLKNPAGDQDDLAAVPG
jgi:hypothetical protein